MAQITNGSTAPNFILDDLNGNEHKLYNYLDQGKYVILDFLQFGVHHVVKHIY